MEGMPQHHLLSAAAISLDPEQFFRMSEEEAHDRLKSIRWAANGGNPVCPRDGCGCDAVWHKQCGPPVRAQLQSAFRNRSTHQ